MASNKTSRLARAKINLDLLINGGTSDGYHLLDSLVVFADFGDHISVQPSQSVSLKISGPFAGSLADEPDNIILKAVNLIQEKFGVTQGANIELVKNLPVSSGIGGGSADAAAAIHAVMDVWGLSDKVNQLGDIPLSLGADVPVCMASKPMQMKGVGETLRPTTLNFPLFILLVNPGVSVSTESIFRARAGRNAPFSPPRNLQDNIISVDHLLDILKAGCNDLMEDAITKQPVIKDVITEIKKTDGCLFSAMSGSGATCYGLFSTWEEVDRAAKSISAKYGKWWVQAGCLEKNH